MYIHGYSTGETQRLFEQSQILSDLFHKEVVFPPGSKVLEPGCGVGAQTVIMCPNNPQTHFFSVDISKESLALAEKELTKRKLTNASFIHADVFLLPFADNYFDHAFVCFLLEHVPEPQKALQEIKRVLRKGASIIEGDHGTCVWHPETMESTYVWRCMIRTQQFLGQTLSLDEGSMHSLHRKDL